jgi:hypothetical protein
VAVPPKRLAHEAVVDPDASAAEVEADVGYQSA